MSVDQILQSLQEKIDFIHRDLMALQSQEAMLLGSPEGSRAAEVQATVQSLLDKAQRDLQVFMGVRTTLIALKGKLDRLRGEIQGYEKLVQSGGKPTESAIADFEGACIEAESVEKSMRALEEFSRETMSM